MQTSLLKNRLGYIDGQWTPADSHEVFTVINPATGEHLADVPRMGDAETIRAVESAAKALETPASPQQRKEWLLAIADGILRNKDELAEIITREHGKTLRDSLSEVEYASKFYSFFAGATDHLNPQPLEEHFHGCQWTIHHRPAGVAGLITPWNFPLAMLAKKFGAALAAGCPSVTKPASLTPLTAVAFWHILEEVNLPKGMANLVMGRASAIGKVFCSHPALRVISLTGSTEVGQSLICDSSQYVKRLSMELGGNAPFIVFDDVDITHAVNELIGNKFRCSGQTCVCANRIFVHRKIKDEFVSVLTSRVSKMTVGDGMNPQSSIGPLIDRSQFDKVAQHVQDALDKGASLVVGKIPGRPKNEWGCFYPPTVLIDVTPEMQVSREETFGPVAAVTFFDDGDDVARMANDTCFGLAAYVFTNDDERRKKILPRLSFGHLGWNTGKGPIPQAPFGGMKLSGFGREGGLEGMMEFCETQTEAHYDE